MLQIRFDKLEKLVDFICDNYDREVDYINRRCSEIFEVILDSELIVSEPFDLADHIEISVSRNGKKKIKK